MIARSAVTRAEGCTELSPCAPVASTLNGNEVSEPSPTGGGTVVSIESIAVSKRKKVKSTKVKSI